MWEMLLQMLLKYVCPALAELVIAFLAKFQATAANDPVLVQYARGMVEQMETTGLSGAEKRAGAFDSIKGYAQALGVDLADSAVNTLIELAVHALPTPPPKTEDKP